MNFVKGYQEKELLKIEFKKTIIDEEIPINQKIGIDYDIQKLLTSTIKTYSMKIIIGGFGFIETYFLEKYSKNIKLRHRYKLFGYENKE